MTFDYNAAYERAIKKVVEIITGDIAHKDGVLAYEWVAQMAQWKAKKGPITTGRSGDYVKKYGMIYFEDGNHAGHWSEFGNQVFRAMGLTQIETTSAKG